MTGPIQIGNVNAGRPPPELRHRIERRLRAERRRGWDRRIVERRLEVSPAQIERRAWGDRRGAIERRSPVARRSWLDRRGSGISFTDLTPSAR
jgi:hypothetical protein